MSNKVSKKELKSIVDDFMLNGPVVERKHLESVAKSWWNECVGSYVAGFNKFYRLIKKEMKSEVML